LRGVLFLNFVTVFFHFMSSQPSKTLDTFPSPSPDRDFHVSIELPEFTCLCPMTGQTAFATVSPDSSPAQRCVELRRLKLYASSFRNAGKCHAAVTNAMANDIATALDPRFLRVTAKWYVRGGIFTNVVVEHRQAGWTPQPLVQLLDFATGSNIKG